MGKRRQQSKRRRAQRKKLWQPKVWREKCKCGKIIFPDEFTADMALTRGVGRKGSIRSYECTVVLGNWHTTSQPLHDIVDDIVDDIVERNEANDS